MTRRSPDEPLTPIGHVSHNAAFTPAAWQPAPLVRKEAGAVADFPQLGIDVASLRPDNWIKVGPYVIWREAPGIGDSGRGPLYVHGPQSRPDPSGGYWPEFVSRSGDERPVVNYLINIAQVDQMSGPMEHWTEQQGTKDTFPSGHWAAKTAASDQGLWNAYAAGLIGEESSRKTASTFAEDEAAAWQALRAAVGPTTTSAKLLYADPAEIRTLRAAVHEAYNRGFDVAFISHATWLTGEEVRAILGVGGDPNLAEIVRNASSRKQANKEDFDGDTAKVYIYNGPGEFYSGLTPGARVRVVDWSYGEGFVTVTLAGQSAAAISVSKSTLSPVVSSRKQAVKRWLVGVSDDDWYENAASKADVIDALENAGWTVDMSTLHDDGFGWGLNVRFGDGAWQHATLKVVDAWPDEGQEVAAPQGVSWTTYPDEKN